MSAVDWTYEVPPFGEGSAGLEQYLVEGADGEPLATVKVVLEHDGERWLVVDSEPAPRRHELHLVPWEAIDSVDHEELVIRLRTPSGEVEGTPVLDPARAVPDRQDDEGVDAIRVTDLPYEFRRPLPPAPEAAVDEDERSAGLLWSLTAAAFVSALAVVIVIQNTGEAWWAALSAIPLALLVLAVLEAYRYIRFPTREAARARSRGSSR